MPSPPWVLATALAIALVSLVGCEKVPAPEGFLNPPERLRGATPPTADPPPPAETPPQHPAQPQTHQRDEPLPELESLIPILSRIALREPSRLGSPQDFTLLTPLPRLTPPRAILQAPSGEEIVLGLGDLIGEGAARISRITDTSITLTSLELGAEGALEVQEIELKGSQPMPALLPEAVSSEAPEGAALETTPAPKPAKLIAAPTPTPKRLIDWADHSGAGSPQ